MSDDRAFDSSPRRLYRNPDKAWMAGVCAGIADYFGISPAVVRVLTFISACAFTFPTVVGYIAAGFILQRRPERLYADTKEEAFWRSVRLEPSRTAKDLKGRFEELERRLRLAEARVTSSEFKLRQKFRDLES